MERKKEELVIYIFELLKAVIPLDTDNGYVLERVITAGYTFFRNEYDHNEFKEELCWLENATRGIHQLCSLYPWVGYAANAFVNALICELEGGKKEHLGLGYEYIFDTEYFLNETLDYCHTSVREMGMCSGVLGIFNYTHAELTAERKRMEILLQNLGYIYDSQNV